MEAPEDRVRRPWWRNNRGDPSKWVALIFAVGFAAAGVCAIFAANYHGAFLCFFAFTLTFNVGFGRADALTRISRILRAVRSLR